MKATMIVAAAIWLGAVVAAMPTLAAAGWGPGYGVALAAPALGGLILISALQVRRGVTREGRLLLRERRLQQLTELSTGLTRLRNMQELASRAEVLAGAVLGCAGIAVQTAAAPPPPPSDAWVGMPLRCSSGRPLGRLDVLFGPGQGRTDAERALLRHVAALIASAMENATMLADAVSARSQVEQILSTISDGMLALDRTWHVRYVNGAALRFLHCTREDLQGAVLWDLFPGLREAAFGARFDHAMRTGEHVDVAAPYEPLGAYFEMRCYPFEGGLTVYFRDIAAQRETEEKLRQSQKLEALGQLTGGIAHDVNNLLTVILGNFEMLAMSAEERGDDGALDLNLAEAGLRAGESASQLMHRLLAFSRRQPLSPQVIDVAALLASLEPLLRRTLGEQITLRIAWQDALWHALVDPAELENAIINLAINARDAMPLGGKLTIEAANVPIDRVYAAVAGLDRIGDFIMLSVSDTGHGMSREVLGKAFDPFFTTKQPGKGTGLGLSMVYGFAKQTGGHVMIDSEPGQGTIVRLYLPHTDLDEAAPDREVERDVPRGSETILLVEDNDLVRAHTEAVLRGLGYVVLVAGDGVAAMALLDDGARPDLLLTDLVLPGGITGRDLADTAAAAVPDLRVLFTSGYPGNMLLENGRVTAGVDVLGKPFRRTHLAARIREQLAGPPWVTLGGGQAGPENSLSWGSA